jgi:hypothetical protein
MVNTRNEYERLKTWAKGRAETDARKFFPDLEAHDAGFDALTALYSLKHLRTAIRGADADIGDILFLGNLRKSGDRALIPTREMQ